MIDVQALEKSFGTNKAVDGVSIEIPKGELFGLLGPNGAGKSTTIAMMAGLLPPDKGTARIGGEDPISPRAKKKIGFAPQALALYERLTAEENLVFFARLMGLSGQELRNRVKWALELAGLSERKSDPVRTFSGGMKRRLNLACALAHSPEVVFLDEPTVGVDPQSRNFLFDNVERLKDEGLTVLYTTHYMEEAERLCDRIAIMDQGKILAIGTVSELLDQYGGDSVLVVEFEQVPNIETQEGELDGTTLTRRSQDPFGELARLAAKGGIRSAKVERSDLESVFLTLTGRSLRD